MDVIFSEWLLERMQREGWSQADLARASGLTRQSISYYLTGKSKQPDELALQQIARAFKISPEQVYRAAGILPQKTANDEWAESMKHKIDLVPASRRSIAESLLDSLIKTEEPAESSKLKAKRVGNEK